ncbi:hypothetical protein [Methylobacterium sp. CM6247]
MSEEQNSDAVLVSTSDTPLLGREVPSVPTSETVNRDVDLKGVGEPVDSHTPLSDEALDSMQGGISGAGIGGIAGGTLGVVGVGVLAVGSGVVAVASAPVLIAGAVVGGVAAGIGAGVGALVDWAKK